MRIRYLKKIFIEYILCIICISIFCFIYYTGTGIKQKFGRPQEKAEIVYTSGIEEVNGKYRTINDDPWIAVSFNPGYAMTIDLEYEDGKSRYGRIFYGGEDFIFLEERAFDYNFVSGKNLIELDSENVRYLRMDIASESDCVFSVRSIEQEGIWQYALKNLNYVLLLLIAAILVALLEGFRNVDHNNTKKVKSFFAILLIISMAIVFGRFIIGKTYYIFYDCGSDTFFQYYPYLVNCVLSIKDGTFSVWNWDYGLGTSILNVISWTMDPFALAVVLCGVILGVQVIQYALVWMQIAKIVLAYLLCKRYLRLFDNNEFAICLGAYLYSFNGYLLLWGQHYFLGTACIYILLVLIAIEKFVRYKGRREGVWVALAVAASLIYSYYTTYMILVVAAIYFLVRYFAVRQNDTLSETFKIFGKCLFSVLSGVCLSGIIFIPACYYTVTNSSRMSGANISLLNRLYADFINSFRIDDIGSRLSRLMSNNLLYINDNSNTYFANYYETPQLFCTIFIFFFVGQWIVYEVKRAQNRKSRIMLALKLILMYFLIFNSVSGLVLNGFVYAAHRYTFVIFPFLSLAVTIIWDRIFVNEKVDIVGIVIGALLSALTWFYSYVNSSPEVRKYVIVVCAFLLVGLGILALTCKYKKQYKNLVSLFFLLIVMSSVLDSYITSNQRVVISKDDYAISWDKGKIDCDTTKAIEWINENDTSFYRLEKNYEDWAVVCDSFFEKYSTVTWYNSTPNTNVSNFYDHIYRDAARDNAVKCFTIDTPLAVCAMSLADTKYILSREPLENSWCEKIYETGDVLVYKNLYTDSVAKWYSKVITQKEFELLDDESRAMILQDTMVTETDMELAKGSKCLVGDFSLTKRTELCGNVVCDDTGLLMLSIPDQKGWTIYVDGKEAQTYNADYGFLAVKLDGGEHNIVAKYRVPKGNLGMYLSLMGIVMICVMGYAEKKANFDCV